jgi:hypothetical protein
MARLWIRPPEPPTGRESGLASAELKGADEFKRRLARMATETPKECARVLKEIGRVKLSEMQRRTELNVQVEEPVVGLGETTVRFVAIGPDVLEVHERIEQKHLQGQPKFMETVILESIGTLGQDIAARLDLGKVLVR